MQLFRNVNAPGEWTSHSSFDLTNPQLMLKLLAGLRNSGCMPDTVLREHVCPVSRLATPWYSRFWIHRQCLLWFLWRLRHYEHAETSELASFLQPAMRRGCFCVQCCWKTSGVFLEKEQSHTVRCQAGKACCVGASGAILPVRSQ